MEIEVKLSEKVKLQAGSQAFTECGTHTYEINYLLGLLPTFHHFAAHFTRSATIAQYLCSNSTVAYMANFENTFTFFELKE